MVRTLYQVLSRSDGQFDVDPRWRETRRGSIFCDRCGAISIVDPPLPIDVTLRVPPHRPVSKKRLHRVSIMVVSRALLDVLLELDNSLIVGRCMLSSGRELTEYATCYKADPVQLRGGIATNYRHCPLCGTILVALPMAERPVPVHVLARELTPSHVHTSRAADLILDEFARQRIRSDAFPDLEFRDVIVVESVDEVEGPQAGL